MRFPLVAPFNSCIGCLRGDTPTGLILRGEAEWIIAGLSVFADIPIDHASLTVLAAFEEDGCEPGKVPAGVVEMPFRLCADCAASSRASVWVGQIRDRLPCFEQPASSVIG